MGSDNNNGVRHQRALSPRLSMMMMMMMCYVYSITSAINCIRGTVESCFSFENVCAFCVLGELMNVLNKQSSHVSLQSSTNGTVSFYFFIYKLNEIC